MPYIPCHKAQCANVDNVLLSPTNSCRSIFPESHESVPPAVALAKDLPAPTTVVEHVAVLERATVDGTTPDRPRAPE